jgi:serine/threonine protein kinase
LLEIPNYKIEKELGRGGMSTVYLAIHTILERQVALKIMSPSYLNNEAFKECFINEGKIISKLNNPHIIHIYDIGISNDACYMAIELLEEDTLHQKIEKKSLSFEDIERIISQVASALTTAHTQNFIHRDIKPKNILFRKNGDAVLTDFGISKVQNTDGDLTTMGYISGTPAYMPPEYSMGEELDHRGDIYSLGVVFFEMLTGEKPYKGKTPAAVSYKHANEPIPKLETKLAHYQTVLDRSLAKKPQDRFDSVKAFALAVKMADPNLADTIIAPRNMRAQDSSETVILQNPNKIFNAKPSPSKKGVLIGLGFIALFTIGAATSYIKFFKPVKNSVETKTIVTTPKKESLEVATFNHEPVTEIIKPRIIVKTENEYPPLPIIAAFDTTKNLTSEVYDKQENPNISAPSFEIPSKKKDSLVKVIEPVKPIEPIVRAVENKTTEPKEFKSPATVPRETPEIVLMAKESISDIPPSKPVKKLEKEKITLKEKPKSKTLSKEQITIISSLLDSCMVRASTAIKEQMRITKNKNIIKEIKGLKMDSGRTKFITDTQRQVQLSQEKFNNNISRYYKNLTKLKAYKVSSVQKQVSLIENNPTTRQVNKEITRIISKHIKLLGRSKLTKARCKKDFSVFANNILNSF